jgi:hypothetical protein
MLNMQYYWDKPASIMWLGDCFAASCEAAGANIFLAGQSDSELDSLYYE